MKSCSNCKDKNRYMERSRGYPCRDYRKRGELNEQKRVPQHEQPDCRDDV